MTRRVIEAGERGELDSIPGFAGAYLKVLKVALSHPSKVLVASLGLLVGAQVTYGVFGSGVEFFPDVEPDNAKIQVRARGNLSLDEQDSLIREVEQQVLDIGGVETFYTRVGPEASSEESEDIIGSISLEFADWRLRPKVRQIFTEIRGQIGDLAGVIIDLRKEEGGPPVGKPIQIQLASRHHKLLAPAAAKVRAQFDSMGGLHSIEDSRPLPGIDWEVVVDRAQAAKYGADIGSVGNMVQMTTMGYKIGTYRPDDSDDEIEIRVRFPEQHRTIEELNHVRLNTPAGSVPISNFVVRQAREKTGMVKRVDGRRVITIRADVEEGVLVNNKINELAEWLQIAEIDPRVQVTFKGEDEERAKAEAFLSRAFLVALFVMAAILITQFNSFYSAFLILFAVVMSTIGVLMGLLITNSPFGIVMNGIGVIALAGIVVNNNIVLIDTHDRLLFFTNTGRVLSVKAYELRPDLSRNTRGVPVQNIIPISDTEKVESIIGVPKLDIPDVYLVMATRQGSIKRTALSHIANIRRAGLIIFNLRDKDSLVTARLADETQDIMMVTREGKSIRFPVTDVTTRQRAAGGVRGISLQDKKDHVVSMDIVIPDSKILVISDHGYGKLTYLKNYRTQGRGGSGIKTMSITRKTGKVAAAEIIGDSDEVYLVSKKAQIIRTNLAEIRAIGRATQGVRVFKPKTGDTVVSISCVSEFEVPEEKITGDANNNGTQNGMTKLI